MNHLMIFAAMSDGSWKPTMADPSLMGWITVGAYFGTALLCEHVWWHDRNAHRAGQSSSPRFWLSLTLLLTFLGAAKELNLQSLLTGTLRSTAKAQSWYADRRPAQLAFIVIVGLLAVVAVAVLAWVGGRACRQNLKRNFPALISTAGLLAFLLIRAASFHYVDAYLYATDGPRWNAIIELSCVGMIAIATGWAIQTGLNRSEHAAIEDGTVDDSTGPRRYSLPGTARERPKF